MHRAGVQVPVVLWEEVDVVEDEAGVVVLPVECKIFRSPISNVNEIQICNYAIKPALKPILNTT